MDKKPHKFLLKSGHFISSTLSLRTQLYTPWQTPAIALSPYPNHCHLFGSTKPDRVVSESKELQLPSHFFNTISNLRMPKNKQKHSKKEQTLHSFADISYQVFAIVSTSLNTTSKANTPSFCKTTGRLRAKETPQGFHGFHNFVIQLALSKEVIFEV